VKVSEKSLELNVGAELLWELRNTLGLTKAYLRGLTQEEERREGVDFFVHLDPSTKIFAFQFKAPQGKAESTPYKHKLVRYQHEELFNLAQMSPGAVHYVFPFYVTPAKLQAHVPNLLSDTWLLDVAPMDTASVFGTKKTTTIRCTFGGAQVNPEYPLARLGQETRIDAATRATEGRRVTRQRAEAAEGQETAGLADDLPARVLGRVGLSPEAFAEWYSGFRTRTGTAEARRRSSWLARGLRVIVVPPTIP
jgi:hypothetical protein